MSDKAAWLTLLERRISRDTWISVLIKAALLLILYALMQSFRFSVPFGLFALGMTILLYFLDVLVSQKKRETSMLYEQARRTPPGETSFLLEPHYDARGKKNGKADLLHVMGDWRVFAFYAFLFVLNLALTIAAAIPRKG